MIYKITDSMDQFTTFNDKLINNKKNITLLDYVKKCNFTNIDISFIDKFIELVSRSDFCIPHSYLQDYGVYKLTGGSSDLDKILERNGFIEDMNYKILLRKLSEQDLQHGGSNKYDYMLTPETFKILLIRSIKCKKYTNYYIYLEKCIKYYNDYQVELNKRYITTLHNKIINYDTVIIPQKDDKIDELSKKIDELMKSNKEIHYKLTDIEEVLDDTKVDLSIVQDKLNIAVEDRAIKPYDKSKVNQIGLLRSIEKQGRYYITCGQKDSVTRVIKCKEDTHVLVDKIDSVPNSIYLFNHIKKQLESNAVVVGRTIQLIRISESEFIDEIKSLFDGRKNIDLTKRP